MEFLNKIFTRDRASVQQLPSGTVTVDRHGQIVTSTVSSSYPNELLADIGEDVLTLFREARAAQIPMAEVSVQFGSLHITARELRGGAIIFLLPQTASFPTSAPSRS
jgi:hypothetical protein